MERCCKYLSKSTSTGLPNKSCQNLEVLGSKPTFKGAPMPSNIMWENLGNLKKDTDHRKRNVFLIIAAIMFINGSVYSGLKQLNATNS